MGHTAFWIETPFDADGVIKSFPKCAKLLFCLIWMLQSKVFERNNSVLARLVNEGHMVCFIINKKCFSIETAAEVFQNQGEYPVFRSNDCGESTVLFRKTKKSRQEMSFMTGCKNCFIQSIYRVVGKPIGYLCTI